MGPRSVRRSQEPGTMPCCLCFSDAPLNENELKLESDLELELESESESESESE